MKSSEYIKDKIKASGLKVTQQRLVIYETLLSMKTHPTSEMLFEQVRTQNPTISLATIYKTLETFVDYNLAKKVMTEDGIMRYDGSTHPHHHIYCTNTSEILDYEDEDLMAVIKDYLEKKNINNLKIDQICVHINGEKISKNDQITIN